MKELRMDGRRALRVAFWLNAMALVVESLAGGLGRTLVEMPAWRRLGPEAWASFSRLADLGNGEIVYSIFGIGGMLLTLGAALAFYRAQERSLSASATVYGAAFLEICVLVLTTRAAPNMLSLRHIGTNHALLLNAFDGFDKWDSIRAFVGTVGHYASIWSLVALTKLRCEHDDHAAQRGYRVTHDA